MIFVVWLDAEVQWVFIFRKYLEVKSKDVAIKIFYIKYKVILNTSRKIVYLVNRFYHAYLSVFF